MSPSLQPKISAIYAQSSIQNPTSFSSYILLQAPFFSSPNSQQSPHNPSNAHQHTPSANNQSLRAALLRVRRGRPRYSPCPCSTSSRAARTLSPTRIGSLRSSRARRCSPRDRSGKSARRGAASVDRSVVAVCCVRGVGCCEAGVVWALEEAALVRQLSCRKKGVGRLTLGHHSISSRDNRSLLLSMIVLLLRCWHSMHPTLVARHMLSSWRKKRVLFVRLRGRGGELQGEWRCAL